MDIMTCPHCRRPADRPLFLPRAQQQIFDYIWYNPWCTVNQIELAIFGSNRSSNLVAVQISKASMHLTGTGFMVSKRDGPSGKGTRAHKQYAIEPFRPANANV